MFESNSKFPRIFVYMMSLLAAMIFVGMFFSIKFVAAVYFIALIISALILLLDKKYGTLLANYCMVYLLFDIVNLIAIISIIYYEFSSKMVALDWFLSILIIIEGLMALIDIFVLRNNDLTKNKNLSIDFLKLCSMICLITYFFNVSKLYFSVLALGFEMLNLLVKVSVLNDKKKKMTKNEKKEQIEEIIHLNGEGDLE